jgi:fructose-bisphosphate aldolase class II
MPLVGTREILVKAREKRYGVPSLLAGNLEMVIGAITAAEEQKSPLILAFNQEVTPKVPMELGIPMSVNAARRARVPVAVILDHGHSLAEVLKAIQLGAPSVMFDGSSLPYEENVKQTREVVRVAHALGVCVEAELGSIAGSASEIGGSGPEPPSRFTDPEVEPRLDLDLVRKIHSMVDIPLVMHGASGLAEDEYGKIVESGISKVCYYTAMGMGAANDLSHMLANAERGSIVYHHLISRAIDYFYADTKRLLDLLGCSGVV